MSHHYNTKALGRAWAPSPIHSPRVSSRGRFGTWPPNTPHQRQTTASEPWYQDLRILRGRLIERLGVLLALFICGTYLALHHDQLFKSSAQAWTHSIHSLRLGGSLLPTWSRVDWTAYAYVSYATTPDHVCNSLMLAESLHRLGARPGTLILYAADLAPTPESNTSSSRLLQQASARYNARLQPVQVLSASASGAGGPTWAQALTKLLAFNQTSYKRVLSLDSDATLLRPMDELFLLPAESKVAMPRAYWLNDTLCTSVMLASPSEHEFARIQARLAENRADEYDMDVINTLYGESCLVIPHKPYLLLTGEMREKSHAAYLGSEDEEWDVQRVLGEAKYVHFSDWPMPKPWVASSEALRKEWMPGCRAPGGKGGGSDCGDRDAWLGLYVDFRERRKRICGREFSGFEQMEMQLKNLPPIAVRSSDSDEDQLMSETIA